MGTYIRESYPGLLQAMKRHLEQHMRLQLLRVVDALDVDGSLLRASETLRVSQPALTKGLRELELLVGDRLFERHARGVTPTKAGMVLIRGGRRILAELARAEEDLEHLASPFGSVAAIGALPVAAAGLVPLVLVKLRQQHPHIKVRVEEGRTEVLLPQLSSGQLDLLVGRFYEPATPDGLIRHVLWSDPIAIVARSDHPLLKVEGWSLDALRSYDLVLPGSPQRAAGEVEQIVNQLGLTVNPSLRASSYGFIREMLLSTDAISIMPPMLVLGDINRGALGTRALPVDTAKRPAGIILANGRKPNGAAQAFIDCLHVHIRQIVDEGLGAVAM
jgi:LysR family pca operon transcriptional activator